MRQFIYTVLLISCLPVWSQDDRIDSLLNDLLYSENEPIIVSKPPVHLNFLYAGVNFNSNTYYAGREIGDDRYNATGYLYFYSSKGLFLGLSGNWYDELTPGYTTTTLSAGYYRAIDKKKVLTFRTSYNRYFYNQPDTSLDYPYKNNFNVGLSFRKKWFGARAGTSLLFGQDFGMNFSAGMNTRITILKFGKSNKIYTSPDLSVFFGSETVEMETSGSQAATDLKDVYSLLNTQLNLPLCISLGDFDLELGYSVNFPATQDEKTTYPVGSYYSLSVGYFLPIY